MRSWLAAIVAEDARSANSPNCSPMWFGLAAGAIEVLKIVAAQHFSQILSPDAFPPFEKSRLGRRRCGRGGSTSLGRLNVCRGMLDNASVGFRRLPILGGGGGLPTQLRKPAQNPHLHAAGPVAASVICTIIRDMPCRRAGPSRIRPAGIQHRCGHDGQRKRVAHMPTATATTEDSRSKLIQNHPHDFTKTDDFKPTSARVLARARLAAADFPQALRPISRRPPRTRAVCDHSRRVHPPPTTRAPFPCNRHRPRPATQSAARSPASAHDVCRDTPQANCKRTRCRRLPSALGHCHHPFFGSKCRQASVLGGTGGPTFPCMSVLYIPQERAFHL